MKYLNLKAIIILTLCHLSLVLGISAQTNEEITAKENKFKDMELDYKMEKLQADIAIQHKAEREAIYGKTIEPLTGSIEAASSAEASILSFDLLRKLAKQIAGDLKGKSQLVIMTGQPDLNLAGAFQARAILNSDLDDLIRLLNDNSSKLDSSLRSITLKLETLEKPEENPTTDPSLSEFELLSDDTLMSYGSSLIAAKGILDAGLSVAALFRSDLNFKGVAITADQAAFLATLSGTIKDQNSKTTINTTLYLKEDPTQNPPGISLLKRFLHTSTAQVKTQAAVGLMKELVKKIETGTAALEEDKAALKKIIASKESKEEEKVEARKLLPKVTSKIKQRNEQLLPEIKNAADEIARADINSKRATDYGESIKKNVILGYSLERLIQADNLQALLDKGYSLLFANVGYAGGTNLTKKNLVSSSFRSSGGVAVSYTLLNSDLTIEKSRTYYNYEGFYKVDTKSQGSIPSYIDDTPPDKAAPLKKAPARKISHR